eukprot:TRINITY_DN13521_c0_g1_i2.p1 TRINITY_DN13521_c0_g1~~TRINITY_DN13521_c0_g1_i2.p1  ORF type:complete len:178 (+),score=32.86 TRINITY_DN13521_c0_g1_i2:74-535(+)
MASTRRVRHRCMVPAAFALLLVQMCALRRGANFVPIPRSSSTLLGNALAAGTSAAAAVGAALPALAEKVEAPIVFNAKGEPFYQDPSTGDLYSPDRVQEMYREQQPFTPILSGLGDAAVDFAIFCVVFFAIIFIYEKLSGVSDKANGDGGEKK